MGFVVAGDEEALVVGVRHDCGMVFPGRFCGEGCKKVHQKFSEVCLSSEEGVVDMEAARHQRHHRSVHGGASGRVVARHLLAKPAPITTLNLFLLITSRGQENCQSLPGDLVISSLSLTRNTASSRRVTCANEADPQPLRTERKYRHL